MSKIYRCEKNHLLDAIEVIDEDGKCLCPHDNTRCHLDVDTDENDELRNSIAKLERLVKHWSTQSSHSSWLAVERHKRIAELEKQNVELVAENDRLKAKLGSASMTIEQNESMKNAFVEFAEIVKMRCDTPLEIAIFATRLLVAYQNDEPYED